MERPQHDQPHYGQHLGDATYWGPYVREVLARHGLPSAEIEPPFVGTFPTFLVGDLVVKLFGPLFGGKASQANERGMHDLLAETDIPAPRLIAAGCVFDEEPVWPYLVTERLRGVPIRDSFADRRGVASALGAVVARIHRLAPPPTAYRHLPDLRAQAPARAAEAGHLPEHLIGQIPEYLSDALPADTLLHADLTEDHIFVANGELLGIIDWGDSLVADPYYDLVPVFFDSIGTDPAARVAFLDGYGSRRADDFPRRMMQAVLEFEFGVIRRIAQLVDLSTIRTFDQLGERLFTL